MSPAERRTIVVRDRTVLTRDEDAIIRGEADAIGRRSS